MDTRRHLRPLSGLTALALVALLGLTLIPDSAQARGGHGYRHGHWDHRGWGGHRRFGHRRFGHRRFGHHRVWRHRRHYPGGSFSFFSSGRHSAFSLSVPLGAVITHPVHAPPPPPRVVYVSPPPPPPPPVQALPAGCRQTREFQTTITIDGQPVPAYGTACLMGDGSWRQLGVNVAR